MKNRPIPQDLIVFGEISLSGEVRPVNQREARLKEAAKLGFQKALAPPKKTSSKPSSHKEGSLDLIPLTHVHQLVQWFENATQKVAKKASSMKNSFT
jgi:DNA repair protein RadA/Sms